MKLFGKNKPAPTTGARPDLTKIKGLSDSRRMPRLEKIRLGAKVQKTPDPKNPDAAPVEYPVELPFFLLPDGDVSIIHGGKIPDPVARAQELGVKQKAVLEFIGDNAHRLAEDLPIMLPMDDTAHTFPQSYKMYGGSIGLKCRGNGEQAEQRKGITNKWDLIKCPCGNLKTDENPKGACSIVANLQVILPDVSMGGVYQIDIGSINSIIDINSGIAYTKSLYQKATGEPRAAMVPLKLSRVATETHHGGKKQTHWTCRLTPVGNINTFTQLAESSKMMLTHAEAEGGLLLPPPDTSDPVMDAPDMVYEQPAEVTAMLDELRALGSKKIKNNEMNDLQTAIDSGDDAAIEAIYNVVMTRIPHGQSAEDVAESVAKSGDKKETATGTEPKTADESVI